MKAGTQAEQLSGCREDELTSLNRDRFGLGVLPDGQQAICLPHCQQAAVWGQPQGQDWPWVLGSMRHLEGVQLIDLQPGTTQLNTKKLCWHNFSSTTAELSALALLKYQSGCQSMDELRSKVLIHLQAAKLS